MKKIGTVSIPPKFIGLLNMAKWGAISIENAQLEIPCNFLDTVNELLKNNKNPLIITLSDDGRLLVHQDDEE